MDARRPGLDHSRGHNLDHGTSRHSSPDDATAQKGGSLFGGALEDPVLDSSPTVLRRHRGGAATVGLQQWFTPESAARLIAGAIARTEGVLDPTAGAGSLLAPFPEEARYGIEIDADHVRAAAGESASVRYRAALGDAQRVVPMLRAAGLRWPAVVANPPFGLSWRDPAHAGRRLNSTVLAYLWSIGLLAPCGQGAIVLGSDRLARELMPLPEAKAIYAVVDVEGPLFDGVALPCSIAFFVRPENRRGDKPSRLSAPRESLPGLAGDVRQARRSGAGPVLTGADPSLPRTFRAVAEENKRRTAARAQGKARTRGGYDASLRGQRVVALPSAYARLVLAKRNRLREVELLHGQNASYFGQNPKAFRQLEELQEEDLIAIDPALKARAERAISEAALVATPLFGVKEQMRLGWLTDLERIRCKKSDPERGFVAGKEYALKTASKVVEETERRLVETKDGRGELRRFTKERRLLCVTIGSHTNSGERAHSFDESPENIAHIIRHFEVPDPGSVATRHPEIVERNRRVLLDIERDFELEKKGKKIKPFQLDHLSRLLVKRRGMLAHEQGLGKTLMQMLLAEAEARLGAAPQALFVAPQDLLPQWQAEAEAAFGRRLTEIRSPADAERVARRIKERPHESGWYITYYEALSVVGRRNEPLPETPLDHREALRDRLNAYKQKKRELERELRPVETAGPPAETPGSLVREVCPGPELPHYGPTSRDACPACRADTDGGWDGEVCGAPKRCVAHPGECPEDGRGCVMRGCGYVHRRIRVKTAGSRLANAFRGGVKCVDEVSEIRGDDSLRSKAVRALARGRKDQGGAHNYGATGTPLSNYLSDAFWGLHFTLGNASVAFPYDYHGKARFEEDFCVVEHLHGREKDGEGHLRVRKKILPQITNVSQFWRLAQPSISRCRKEQTGEPIVPRTYHPIRVPMGQAQKAMHDFWLRRFEDYFRWKHPDHPLVESGLVEKYQAALGMLWRLEASATLPAWDEPTREFPPAARELGAPSNWTPAMLKTLELALQHAADGEKVLIGSGLKEAGPFIAARLKEKGVRAVHITEERAGKTATKSPKRRARAVRDFAEGDAQVLCVGIQSMKLGHNLQAASTVIVHGLPYSHMLLDQFIARVHRLTSPRPVNIYTVIPKGSLTETKWNLLKEKGNSSDLAFDGELFVQPEKPVDWNKVLKEMRSRGIGARVEDGDLVPEADVEAAYEKLAPVFFLPSPPKPELSHRGASRPPLEGSLALVPGGLPEAEPFVQDALF